VFFHAVYVFLVAGTPSPIVDHEWGMLDFERSLQFDHAPPLTTRKPRERLGQDVLRQFCQLSQLT
jgi:hypothetical protein